MLTACFDASGSQHDQEFLVVAGFIASTEAWSNFDKAWQERLGADGISVFQMNQFASFKGQFRNGWQNNEGRRRALLNDLMEIILKYAFRKFGCVIENKKFREIVTDEELKKWRLDAYSYAGLYCVFQVDQWRQFEKVKEMPLFVFENGDLGKGLLEIKLRDAGFGTPVFRPKVNQTTKLGVVQGFIPLQAADFLAYEIFHANKELGKPNYKPRWAMVEFHRNKVGGLVKYDYQALNTLKADLDFNQRLKDVVERLDRIKEK